MVKIGVWKEKNLFLIHIREYTRNYGIHLATDKGIALTYDVWHTILNNLDHIKQDIEEMYSSMNRDGGGSDYNGNSSYIGGSYRG